MGLEYGGYLMMGAGLIMEAGGTSTMGGGLAVASTGVGAPAGGTMVAGGAVTAASGWAVAGTGAVLSAAGLYIQSAVNGGLGDPCSSRDWASPPGKTSSESMNFHFDKHGKKLGFKSVDEYTAAAKNFFERYEHLLKPGQLKTGMACAGAKVSTRRARISSGSLNRQHRKS